MWLDTVNIRHRGAALWLRLTILENDGATLRYMGTTRWLSDATQGYFKGT